MSVAALPEQVKSADDLHTIVRAATKVLPVGSSTKPALSRSGDNVTVVDMRGLSGIVEYEPAEYTITALAGTPISEIDTALRKNGQFLPFDPVLVQAGATAGGTVASGVSGSGRLRYGGIRDFILGVRFVDGNGVLHRGGGKVVKNAAGFDFPKLLVGSLGRLGIVTEVTFKVFPRPSAYSTVVTGCNSLADALKDMSALSVSPIELLAMDLEPCAGGAYKLVTRIGGDEDLLDVRAARLAEMLPSSEVVSGEEELQQWADVSEFSWVDDGAALVKIPLTPARIPGMEAALSVADRRRRYAVAGNVLWIAWSSGIGELHELLEAQELRGVVLRGEPPRPLIGSGVESVFARRVRSALDPEAKFQSLYPE